MIPFPHNSRWRTIVVSLLLLTLVVIGVLSLRRILRLRKAGSGADREDVSAQTVADFYTSLAALDVEEPQLAATTLAQTVKTEPREPALWANLAIARMRLQDTQAAGEMLQQAIALAPDSLELAMVQAEFLQASGQPQQAIVPLRQIHVKQPTNIPATYALATLLGQQRTPAGDAERLTLLSEILERIPGNLRARCDRARLAAALEQPDELRAALNALLEQRAGWPAPLQEQLTQASQAAQDSDFRSAGRSLLFFENLLKPRPEYQQSLAQLGVSSATAPGTPLREFLRLRLPAPRLRIPTWHSNSWCKTSPTQQRGPISSKPFRWRESVARPKPCRSSKMPYGLTNRPRCLFQDYRNGPAWQASRPPT